LRPLLDRSRLYIDGEAGVKQIETVMAHEGVHMQNFIAEAQMGADSTFETWLEEMSAMMMEDWSKLQHRSHPPAIRDSATVHTQLQRRGSYNCGLTEWTPWRVLARAMQ